MATNNASYRAACDQDYRTAPGSKHFCADDYSWTVADNNYFAWCGRSLSCLLPYDGSSYQRADANIRFAKIRQ